MAPASRRLEESEGSVDAARSICIAALNTYEKCLLDRSRTPHGRGSASHSKEAKDLELMRFQDPIQLKNQMLESVPNYRSGDHFLKVYRNWARLEEQHGTIETVEDVYNRASIAFPLEWKLPLDWAQYHVHHAHFERARLLFSDACDKASNK